MQKKELFLLPAAGAALGVIVTVLLLKLNPSMVAAVLGRQENSVDKQLEAIVREQNKMFSNFDAVFDDDFLHQGDPFEAMRKFREKLNRRSADRNWKSGNPFDSWFGSRFGDGSIADISRREDNNFVYYDIKIGAVDGNSVKTSVENGYLTITGEEKKEVASGSVFRSSFRRSFPLPANIVINKMVVAKEPGAIVLKFPKYKGDT